MIPDSVKLIKNKKVQFYYENGQCLILNAEFIRACSPSAENKNHAKNPDVKRFKGVGISKIEKVGNYALRFIFDDGHDTGIYSWEYIIEISRLSWYFLNPSQVT